MLRSVPFIPFRVPTFYFAQSSGETLGGVPDKCRLVRRLIRGWRAGPAVNIVK